MEGPHTNVGTWAPSYLATLLSIAYWFGDLVTAKALDVSPILRILKKIKQIKRKSRPKSENIMCSGTNRPLYISLCSIYILQLTVDYAVRTGCLSIAAVLNLWVETPAEVAWRFTGGRLGPSEIFKFIVKIVTCVFYINNNWLCEWISLSKYTIKSFCSLSLP